MLFWASTKADRRSEKCFDAVIGEMEALKTTSAWGDDLESEDEGDVEGPLPKGWQSMVFAAAFHNLCVSFF